VRGLGKLRDQTGCRRPYYTVLLTRGSRRARSHARSNGREPDCRRDGPRQRSSRLSRSGTSKLLTPQVRIFHAEAARRPRSFPGVLTASATGRSPGGQFEVERATRRPRSSRFEKHYWEEPETRKTSSRRPAIASATTSSAVPYIWAVSIWVMPRSRAQSRDCSGASATSMYQVPDRSPQPRAW